ncbi:Nramp family divalent metal transporter [Portibacter lacus]|uniref:Metal ion (Mn2+/Fe2+) transporter (Nramp) family metal ion transporter n=1 Tax=Portibacter lacus TaxID=1099794 RepID=A0AA37SVW6_9BACT|nr:Nramp family divalent metal transporter [Portibacter lacus]GLR19821.1 metal ion (Mn2+/Fe2+) transporter (Nramp) family metal ion transporter [Portibacter lacus]
MKKLGLFLASISPGLFLIGYNIGTGSITTMASAGASYGMELILPVLLSCIFTYFLIIIFGQYTIVTGDTILHSYRKYFGTGFSAIVLVSLLISEWVACMGVMGVIVQVVQEWSKPLTSSGEGFSPILVTAIFGGIIYWIFWQGKHRFFERVLVVFVAIMGFCFIATMFMVAPSAETILDGLVPRIPRDKSEMLLLAGMVGTTMGGVLYVVRSILVQEKKWSIKDMKLENRDAAISAGLMFILSFAIMAAAAGTLHVNNLRIDNAIDMVNLLEPLMGRFSVTIFVVGIVCAGLSSLFPIVLLAPWLISDFRNTKRDLTTTSSKLLVLFGVLLGFVVPIFGGRPVFVMIVSQAAASIVTPLILILMMILVNKKAVMGDYTAKLPRNILLAFIILFTIAIAISGILGIF